MSLHTALRGVARATFAAVVALAIAVAGLSFLTACKCTDSSVRR